MLLDILGRLARLERSAAILWSLVGHSPVHPTEEAEARADFKVPLRLPEEGEEEHLASGLSGPHQQAETEVDQSGPVSRRGMGLASEERRAATVVLQVVTPFTVVLEVVHPMQELLERLAGQVYLGLEPEEEVGVQTTRQAGPGERLIRSPLVVEELPVQQMSPVWLAHLAPMLAEMVAEVVGRMIMAAQVVFQGAGAEAEEVAMPELTLG